MVKILILLVMIFMHIWDDFSRQGILASMKQKSWWIEGCKKENLDFEKYKHDYIVCLFTHAFSWAFMVFLPTVIWRLKSGIAITWFDLVVFIYAIIRHAYTDDLKANKYKINLVQDQLWHYLQIILVWIFLVVIGV